MYQQNIHKKKTIIIFEGQYCVCVGGVFMCGRVLVSLRQKVLINKLFKYHSGISS